MNKAYRIYLGARNTPNRTFLPKDEKTLKALLDRYFKSWTIARAEGSWQGATEDTRIITVTTEAGINTNPKHSPIEACSNQLKATFQQYAIMLEEGGLVSIL